MASAPTKDTPPEKEKGATPAARGRSPNKPTTTTTRGRSPNKPTTATIRGRSPNKPTTTTNRGRSPNPSPKKPVRNNSPSPPEKSEKPIPNYLKPTISNLISRNDESTENPALLRRRSFDKPPSTLHSQKSRGSPSPTFRSSSSKITSPQRRVPDRNLRTTKESGKQHTTLYATTKKSSTTKKHETSDKSMSSKAKEILNVTPSKQEDEPEKGDGDLPQSDDNGDGTETEDQESTDNHIEISNLTISEPICNEEEAAENKDSENAVLEHQEPVKIEQAEDNDAMNEDPLVEVQEPIDVNQTEQDSEHMDPVIDSEHQNDKIEAIDELLEAPENQNTEVTEDTEQKELNEEDETKQEINSDESVDGKISKEVEGEEEMGLSKEEEPDSGNGDCEAEEKDEQQVTVEKEAEVSQVEAAHENNDTPVSNDVVEDTESKLREQRRNKVRALAGAFESAMGK